MKYGVNCRCHVISNAKGQLKHSIPEITYKKKLDFLTSMNRDCSVDSRQIINQTLYYSYSIIQ